MAGLTRIQREIVFSVATAGTVKSLLRLTDALDIDYKHARGLVDDLARRGVLTVHHPGRDLVITMGDIGSDWDLS